MKIVKCRKCLNSTINPSISINEKGLCNVCVSYEKKFDAVCLKEELEAVKAYVRNSGQHDCMIGLSGGKDSTAMLQTVIQMGFNPLAFSFNIGYNNLNATVETHLRNITAKMNTDFEIIDVGHYVSSVDRKCFALMGDVYEKAENGEISQEEFRNIYNEGRKHYSTKDNIEFPYVRPCQICRKIAIKAYYGEAVKRNISLVFVGINEWATVNNNGKYSAVRRLKPFPDQPEVLIVHLPYLVQRKYNEIIPILEEMHCKEEVQELKVETGGNCCLLAKACERTATKLLGFHLDSARLSREITVGFITAQQAEDALSNGKRISEYSVNEILKNNKLI